MRQIPKHNRNSLNIFLGVLAGGILSTFSSAAQAQTVEFEAQTPAPVTSQTTEDKEFFDNNGIVFKTDAIVQFKFIRSHGAYQSVFGVRNETTGEEIDLIGEVKPSDLTMSEYEQTLNRPSDGQTDNVKDFLGTLGNAVPLPGTAEFTFKKGNRYSFYLKSQFRGRNAGILYSNDTKNPAGNRQAKFVGDFSSLGNGGVIIRWDDSNSQIPRINKSDNDFDDFIVMAGGFEECADNDSSKTQ
ncbi:MAG: hypothetical protein AAFS12_08790 [Cyanobacteria bacterium J06632_19]